MMVDIPDREADLRLYYDQVIDTHKKLAVVLSDVADKVVDGRIPNHDLPKMLRDLAEREGIMADNWTLVRDGLLNKIINNAVPDITDVSTTAHHNDGNDDIELQIRMSKKRKLDLTEQPESEARRALSRSQDGTSIQENTQLEAKSQANQNAKLLLPEERSKLVKKLQKANKAYHDAKLTGDVEQQLRADLARNEFEFMLRQHNQAKKVTQPTLSVTKGANKMQRAALQILARQQEEQKQEQRTREAAERLRLARWRVDNVKKLVKEATECNEKQQKTQNARNSELALKVQRVAAEASAILKEQQSNAERAGLYEKKLHGDRDRVAKRTAEEAFGHEKRLQDNREREARRVARSKARDAAEAPDRPALSFQPPQRPLPALVYEAEDLIIKEEVIEAWQI